MSTSTRKPESARRPLSRPEMMARVRSVDTRPELTVRRLLHVLGYRFRLHAADLPGRPDVVFRRRKVAIFVHGCFWHSHTCAKGTKRPVTNVGFWAVKLTANAMRDARNCEALTSAGWRVLVIWECETKDLGALGARLADFLEG